MRVFNSVEKNVLVQPMAPIVVPAATATVVLADLTSNTAGEWAARYIQNVGTGDLYYLIGSNQCSPVMYNGILSCNTNQPTNLGGQQLDCSNFGQQVSVYSVSGTTVAITLLRRVDLHAPPNIPVLL